MRQRTRAVYLSLFATLLLTSCAMRPAVFDGSAYMGDHLTQKLYGEKGSVVMCVDPEFDDFVCMKKEDFLKYTENLLYKRK